MLNKIIVVISSSVCLAVLLIYGYLIYRNVKFTLEKEDVSVYVDPDTGVNYLIYEPGSRECAMTVRLNRDGSVMVDEVGTNTSEKAASSSDAASTESVSEETKDSSEISLESTYSKEKSFLDQTTEDNNGILERTYLFPQVN